MYVPNRLHPSILNAHLVGRKMFHTNHVIFVFQWVTIAHFECRCPYTMQLTGMANKDSAVMH